MVTYSYYAEQCYRRIKSFKLRIKCIFTSLLFAFCTLLLLVPEFVLSPVKTGGKKIIFKKLNVIKIGNCVNNFNVSPTEPLPLNVLCHSAAARSFLHTLWWARPRRHGAALHPSPAFLVAPSAQPPSSCAARLLRKTDKDTAGSTAVTYVTSPRILDTFTVKFVF